MDFDVPAYHRVNLKESENRDRNLDLARELKTIKHEGNCDTNCNWCTRDNPQRIGEGPGRLGNKRSSRDYSENSILKIGQNTEEIPGDKLQPEPKTEANGAIILGDLSIQTY